MRRYEVKASNIFKSILLTISVLFFSSLVIAQAPPSEGVKQGALAWDNWTKGGAGGGDMLPGGVVNKDYLRCKACHGWDARGTDGGYARRSRKETRPNAGAGDGDATSRAITRGAVTAAMVTHTGTGRTFTEGTGSWVGLNDPGMQSAGNKAAHANGYTLGNQHPDFSGGDMTQTQIDNLVEFLNFMDADSSVYFTNIDPGQNPVLYTIVDTADAAAGETFYNSNCSGCHGDPATDHNGGNMGHPAGGMLAYLAKDGKFSEFAHKARWGMPGTSMSYASIGSPTSANVADVMLYLQELGGTGFAINPGLSGHWWNRADRNGEGFLVDASLNSAGDIVVIVSFYTYDSMGNQVWIVGSGPAVGNQVVVEFEITGGALWGANFDPADVTRTTWGTGTFTFPSCGAGHILLLPNSAMQADGFTDLEYDIARDVLTPGIKCPTPTS